MHAGCVLHTNHFAADDFSALDYTTMVESTSRTRLSQITSTVSGPRHAPTWPSYERF